MELLRPTEIRLRNPVAAWKCYKARAGIAILDVNCTMSDLILVDGGDAPKGYAEKVLCHSGDGRLHRAFTVLLFDDDGRLLLTRRSSTKMLWPKQVGWNRGEPSVSGRYVCVIGPAAAYPKSWACNVHWSTCSNLNIMQLMAIADQKTRYAVP